MKCIFCNNSLDNSDEHIIPSSINGRLHSKKLICSNCNSVIFGTKIDPVLSELFKSLIHILGLKNARGMLAEDEKGNKYLIDKNKNIKALKPEVKVQRKNDGIHFSIQGDKKQVLDYLHKKAKRKKTNKKFVPLISKKFKLREKEVAVPILKIEHNFEITQNVILELYKIALEFYCYSGLEQKFIEGLLKRVYKLDDSLNDIVFCNLQGDVQMFDIHEISHKIYLKSDVNERILYCYVELFNVICAVIPLVENYTGDNVELSYYQDVLTGKVIDKPIHISLKPSEVLKSGRNYKNEDFNLLFNLLLKRNEYRLLEDTFDLTLSDILNEVKKEIEDGKLNKNRLQDEYLERSVKFIAETSVYYPYFIEDLDDEKNDSINYINSNLNERYFRAFYKINKKAFGLNVKIDENNTCTLVDFIKHPILKRNGVTIIKVYCVLENHKTKELQYFPYYPVFEEMNFQVNEYQKAIDNLSKE